MWIQLSAEITGLLEESAIDLGREGKEPVPMWVNLSQVKIIRISGTGMVIIGAASFSIYIRNQEQIVAVSKYLEANQIS